MASEQVERTYDDSRLEDLVVPLIQGVELIRGCLSDGHSFSTKRLAFPLCHAHCKVLKGRMKILVIRLEVFLAFPVRGKNMRRLYLKMRQDPGPL